MDFCVVRPGESGCDAATVPGGTDITATLTFGVGVFGRITTIGVNPSATLQVTASVIEVARKRFAAFESIEQVAAGKLIPETLTLLSLPLPKPELDDADTRQPVVLTAVLRRGQVYRFQLSVAAQATSGAGGAKVNFRERFLRRPAGSLSDLLGPPGFIMLRDLSIHVTDETTEPIELIASLQAVIASLQEQLGRLSEQANTAVEQVRSSIGGALQQHDDLADRTTTLERRTDDLEVTTADLHRQVRALNTSGAPVSGPQLAIDTPAAAAAVSQPFRLGGWAIDLDAPTGTGVATIHVWAYPVSGGPPQFVGTPAFGPRPDVASKYGPQFRNSGFGLFVEGLPPGSDDLAVFPWSTVRGDFTEARTVRVVVGSPQ